MERQEKEHTSLVEYLTIVQRTVESDGWLESFEKLHIVVGNDVCDLDSAVSALVYAFHLWKLNENPLVAIAPVLNIPKADYDTKTEVKFALTEQGIDQTSLLFSDSRIDPVRLLNLGKLILTLVDHHVPVGIFAGGEGAVVEVIDHHPVNETRQTRFLKRVKLTIEPVGSCATLIAEKLFDHPNLRTLTPVTSFLLYETIVLDTVNFTAAARRTTQKDIRVADQLVPLFSNRLTREEIYEKLAAAKADLSGLTVKQILGKNQKLAEGFIGKVAICTIPVLCQDLFEFEKKQQDIEKYCIDSGLKGVVILGSTLKDALKRDVVLFAADASFLSEMVVKLCTPSPEVSLQLFRDYTFQPCDVRIQHFQQGNTSVSRRQIVSLVTTLLGPLVESPRDAVPPYKYDKLRDSSDEQQVPALSPSDFGIEDQAEKEPLVHRIRVGSSHRYDDPDSTDELERDDETDTRRSDGRRSASPAPISQLKSEHKKMASDVEHGTLFRQGRDFSQSTRDKIPSSSDVVDGNPASTLMTSQERENVEANHLMMTPDPNAFSSNVVTRSEGITAAPGMTNENAPTGTPSTDEDLIVDHTVTQPVVTSKYYGDNPAGGTAVPETRGVLLQHKPNKNLESSCFSGPRPLPGMFSRSPAQDNTVSPSTDGATKIVPPTDTAEFYGAKPSTVNGRGGGDTVDGLDPPGIAGKIITKPNIGSSTERPPVTPAEKSSECDKNKPESSAADSSSVGRSEQQKATDNVLPACVPPSLPPGPGKELKDPVENAKTDVAAGAPIIKDAKPAEWAKFKEIADRSVAASTVESKSTGSLPSDNEAPRNDGKNDPASVTTDVRHVAPELLKKSGIIEKSKESKDVSALSDSQNCPTKGAVHGDTVDGLDPPSTATPVPDKSKMVIEGSPLGQTRPSSSDKFSLFQPTPVSEKEPSMEAGPSPDQPKPSTIVGPKEKTVDPKENDSLAESTATPAPDDKNTCKPTTMSWVSNLKSEALKKFEELACRDKIPDFDKESYQNAEKKEDTVVEQGSSVTQSATITPEVFRSESVDKRKKEFSSSGFKIGRDEVDTGPMGLPLQPQTEQESQSRTICTSQPVRPDSPTPDGSAGKTAKADCPDQLESAFAKASSGTAANVKRSEENETASLFMQTWEKEMGKRATSAAESISPLSDMSDPRSPVYPWSSGSGRQTPMDEQQAVMSDRKTNEFLDNTSTAKENTNVLSQPIASKDTSIEKPTIAESSQTAREASSRPVVQDQVDGPATKRKQASDAIPDVLPTTAVGAPSPQSKTTEADPVKDLDRDASVHLPPRENKAEPPNAPKTETSGTPSENKNTGLSSQEPTGECSVGPAGDLVWVKRTKAAVPLGSTIAPTDASAKNLQGPTKNEPADSHATVDASQAGNTAPVQPDVVNDHLKATGTGGRDVTDGVGPTAPSASSSESHQSQAVKTTKILSDSKPTGSSESTKKGDDQQNSKVPSGLRDIAPVVLTGPVSGESKKSEIRETEPVVKHSFGGTVPGPGVSSGEVSASDKITEVLNPSRNSSSMSSTANEKITTTSDPVIAKIQPAINKVEETPTDKPPATSDPIQATATNRRCLPNPPGIDKMTEDEKRAELFQKLRAQTEAKAAAKLPPGQDQVDSAGTSAFEPKLKRQKLSLTGESFDSAASVSGGKPAVNSDKAAITGSRHKNDSTSFDGECDSSMSSPTDLTTNSTTASNTTPTPQLLKDASEKSTDAETQEIIWAIDMDALEQYKKVLEVRMDQGDVSRDAIVCFYACYLPPHNAPKYEFLMQNIFRYFVSTLDLLADHQCSLVYFNGAVPSAIYPATNWLHQCYKMIDRRMEKNLEEVIIVHPNFWLKAQLQTIGRAFLSGNFYNKIRYVYNLASLRLALGMTEETFGRMDIPTVISDAEAKWNSKPVKETPGLAGRFAMLRKSSF